MPDCLSDQKFRQVDDVVLVRHVQTSSPARRLAACVLMGRYREALLRRCRARLGNRSDAEDAVQEALLRAARSIHGFKGEAGFKTWLFVIADNQCNTLLAQRARRQITDHLRSLIEIQQQTSTQMPQEENESVHSVRKALTDISHRDREILTLRFYGELSIEDLAHTLGVKLSAAKMRLCRAMQRFEISYRHHSRAEVDG